MDLQWRLNMKIIDKIKYDWKRGSKISVVFGLTGIFTICALFLWLLLVATHLAVTLISVFLAVIGLIYAFYLLL